MMNRESAKTALDWATNIDIVDHGVREGIPWFVGRTSRRYGQEGHQFNGYVKLPEDHPIMILGGTFSVADKYLDVHGGVAYAEGDIVGFDTNHFDDDAEKWPQFAVKMETLALARQVSETNTDENRSVAKEVEYFRKLATESIDWIESLGFDKDVLGL